jgi:hypothetical protein
MTKSLRLGFLVKVMGVPDFPSNDTRQWANNPHPMVSRSSPWRMKEMS